MSKKEKKDKKKDTSIPMIFTFIPMEPKVHPNEDQEDPLHGKFEKTIEIKPWGPTWV